MRECSFFFERSARHANTLYAAKESTIKEAVIENITHLSHLKMKDDRLSRARSFCKQTSFFKRKKKKEFNFDQNGAYILVVDSNSDSDARNDTDSRELGLVVTFDSISDAGPKDCIDWEDAVLQLMWGNDCTDSWDISVDEMERSESKEYHESSKRPRKESEAQSEAFSIPSIHGTLSAVHSALTTDSQKREVQPDHATDNQYQEGENLKVPIGIQCTQSEITAAIEGRPSQGLDVLAREDIAMDELSKAPSLFSSESTVGTVATSLTRLTTKTTRYRDKATRERSLAYKHSARLATASGIDETPAIIVFAEMVTKPIKVLFKQRSRISRKANGQSKVLNDDSTCQSTSSSSSSIASHVPPPAPVSSAVVVECSSGCNDKVELYLMSSFVGKHSV